MPERAVACIAKEREEEMTQPHRQTDNSYRGFEREVIDANPVLHLAWVIAQIKDDAAPLGWWRHVSFAEMLLDNFEIKPRPGRD